MNLIQNTRELTERWQSARLHWRDARALEFEKKYMEPLSGITNRTGAMISELENLLRKIRKDCEPLP